MIKKIGRKDPINYGQSDFSITLIIRGGYFFINVIEKKNRDQIDFDPRTKIEYHFDNIQILYSKIYYAVYSDATSILIG